MVSAKFIITAAVALVAASAHPLNIKQELMLAILTPSTDSRTA
jgi:hypothetical protein